MDVVKASHMGLHRKKREKKRDRKVFSRTAGRTRRENINVTSRPMRGGIRL